MGIDRWYYGNSGVDGLIFRHGWIVPALPSTMQGDGRMLK
jgi:hypothetical protein